MEPQATAVNPANGFSATFMPEGLRLRGRQGIGADATMFTSIWRLAGLG